MRLNPRGVTFFDETVLDLVRVMAKQFWRDRHIAAEIRRRFPAYGKVSAINVAGVRSRHAIPAGATYEAEDIARRIGENRERIERDIRDGLTEEKISRRYEISAYHVSKIRCAMGVTSPRTAAEQCSQQDRIFDRREAAFSAAIRATGRDFSDNVRTVCVGRPVAPHPSHVMTQSSAGNCVDVA